MAPILLPSSITSLSDQELADSLREYNFPPGPILPTTRRVYEMKLFKLQSSHEGVPESDPDEENDDEDEDDNVQEVDEEVTFQHQQPRQRTTKTIRTEMYDTGKPSPRRPLHQGIASSRSDASRTHSQSPPAKSSKGGLPLWAKLLAILIVAVVVFLVIKNMESDPASDIPEQYEEIKI